MTNKALAKKLRQMSKIPLSHNPEYQAIVDAERRRKKRIARMLLEAKSGT